MTPSSYDRHWLRLVRILVVITHHMLNLFVALSMDSARGRELFMFDRSLMERLVDNGYQMSQLNVQRRMRPSISHFIRYIHDRD